MKKQFYTVLVLFLAISFMTIRAQDISVTIEDTIIYGDPGVLELVLNAEITNTSSANQTIFLVRTENILPENWTSALCFDINCYPSTIDSVTTTEPLAPGGVIEASVHFYPDAITPGTANVQIQLGTSRNPTIRTTYNLLASTEPSAVNNDNQVIKEFNLYQNYPNPFNPATVISYAVPHRTNVDIKVYDITGKEVSTLVNEVKDQGIYNVEFNAENLSSGIYFYRISADRFSTVRKMILIK